MGALSDRKAGFIRRCSPARKFISGRVKPQIVPVESIEAQEALDRVWFVQRLEEIERTDFTLSFSSQGGGTIAGA